MIQLRSPASPRDRRGRRRRTGSPYSRTSRTAIGVPSFSSALYRARVPRPRRATELASPRVEAGAAPGSPSRKIDRIDVDREPRRPAGAGPGGARGCRPRSPAARRRPGAPPGPARRASVAGPSTVAPARQAARGQVLREPGGRPGPRPGAAPSGGRRVPELLTLGPLPARRSASGSPRAMADERGMLRMHGLEPARCRPASTVSARRHPSWKVRSRRAEVRQVERRVGEHEGGDGDRRLLRQTERHGRAHAAPAPRPTETPPARAWRAGRATVESYRTTCASGNARRASASSRSVPQPSELEPPAAAAPAEARRRHPAPAEPAREGPRLRWERERQAAAPRSAGTVPQSAQVRRPGEAEPVEDEEHGRARGRAPLARRRGARVRGSPPRLPRQPQRSRASTPATRARRAGSHASAPAAGGHPALEARRGAREEARAALATHALEGKIADMPARRIGRLVRGILLVDDHRQAERRQREPRGRPRPDRQPGLPRRHAHHAAQRSRGEAALVTSRAGSPRRVSSRAAQARASSISGARTRTLPPVAQRLADPALDAAAAIPAGDELRRAGAARRGGDGASAAGAPERMPGGSARTRPPPRRSPSPPPPSGESSSSAGVSAGTGSRMAASASRVSSPGPRRARPATTTPGRGRPRKGTRTRCPGRDARSSSGGTPIREGRAGRGGR